ncbi:hypothetical protein acdb102_47960 [Acidothermaceae bacterium B102]|nr:hypothetical protein acdb102_47960 [Acidothermaceae bacterium B102]
MSDRIPEVNRSLHIGELASLAGVTTRSVRYYHAIGVLPEPPRDESGYRSYGSHDLELLAQIVRLRAADVPLTLIVQLLADGTPSDARAAALSAVAQDVDTEIQRLQAVHHQLMSLVDSGELSLGDTAHR